MGIRPIAPAGMGSVGRLIQPAPMALLIVEGVLDGARPPLHLVKLQHEISKLPQGVPDHEGHQVLSDSRQDGLHTDTVLRVPAGQTSGRRGGRGPSSVPYVPPPGR